MAQMTWCHNAYAEFDYPHSEAYKRPFSESSLISIITDASNVLSNMQQICTQ